MQVLILFAHPEHRSTNGAMLDRALQAFERQGHSVEVSDLYRMDFRAEAGRHDFTTRAQENTFDYQAEQLYAWEHDGFSAEITTQMEKLTRADLLLLIFPFWWYSVPAVLKGWFDRVLALGFAYDGTHSFDHGKFKGKKAMVAMTVGGRASGFEPESFHGDILSFLWPLHHGVLQFLGMEVLPPFVVYQAAGRTQEDRARLMDEFEQRLESLETTDPIPFRSLADYDDDLRPLNHGRIQ